MTTRQESLKEEIFQIADYLHFGINNDSPDWFYLFVQRASDLYLSNTDSTGMKYKKWLKISKLELSDKFVQEFKNELSVHSHFIKNYNSVCKSDNR